MANISQSLPSELPELVIQPNNPLSLTGEYVTVVTGISADDNLETKVT